MLSGNFRDFMQSAPDELTAYAALLHGPDGSPIVGVIPCYCGDITEGERVLKPLRSFGSPAMDVIQPRYAVAFSISISRWKSELLEIYAAKRIA